MIPRPVRHFRSAFRLLSTGVSLFSAISAAGAQQRKAPPPPRDTLSASDREALRQTRRDAQAMVRRRGAGDSTARRARADSAATTAFASPEARAILLRAREARERQDSALTAYRATTTQRMSVGLGVKRVGMEKLLWRSDNVAKIAWKRGVGVWVTPQGSRMTMPMTSEVSGDIVSAVTVPYFPGRETLWFPSSNFGVVKTDVDEREQIHPIARGAEAYYRYETGDSIDIKLDGGRVIRLRELKITARKPEWRLFVGSFWFDRDGGQLVRAAYRLSVDIDIWDVASEEIKKDAIESKEIARVRDSLALAKLPTETYEKYLADRKRREANGSNEDDEPPAWVKATFRPAKAKLDAITVEYGLYGGKFWLPRQNSATASAQMGFMRVPVQIDEKFTYDEVNGDFTLPALPAPVTRVSSIDSTKRDTLAEIPNVQVTVGVSANNSKERQADSTRRATRSDSLAERRAGGRRAQQCAADSMYTRVETKYEGALRVAYAMPCDESKLRNSATLPPAYGADEQLFDTKSRDELLASLDMSLQPGFAPMPVHVRTGIDVIRYNRIEGLSLGLAVTQTLGAGYAWSALGRFGLADRSPNGELSLARSNGPRTVTLTGYRRLAATNPEWAGALSFAPSLPALIYGRDEGFYYRAYGAELSERREFRKGSLEYRLFIERQSTAGDSDVVNTFSLARAVSGRKFRENIPSEPVSLTGVTASWLRAFGNDPRGLQLSTTTRVEAATGTFAFARAAVEGTATRPIGRFSTALTGSMGSSLGRLPVQRLWYVGGLRTVRGEIPGTQSGNAYWLARAEVGTKAAIVRPVVFFDVGWAGRRDAIGRTQPQRGTGVGLGFLDGLFRIDLARGLYPARQWRTDIYFAAPL